MAAEAKRAVRPHPQQMVKCPRCESPDTKFCYYNNYSTTQPRYFCKNCKRYWTDGGTLRNVPVGGGLRKNKRSNKAKISNPASSSPPPLLSSSSTHHKPSSSTPSSCNIISNIASNHAILNFPNENQQPALPPSSMSSSGYFVFNPRMYESGDQATHANLPPYHEGSFSHHILPPLPLSLLAGGLKQQGPPSTTPFFSGYGSHERALTEGLQPGGLVHHSSMDTSGNYTTNNFVNVNDWQQISEGLFGGGGESNYMFMQPPQPPQWADFDSGTRL